MTDQDDRIPTAVIALVCIVCAALVILAVVLGVGPR